MSDHDAALVEMARDPHRGQAAIADALGWPLHRFQSVSDTLRRRGLLACSGRHNERLLTRSGKVRATRLTAEVPHAD